jgi:hypothetical protein
LAPHQGLYRFDGSRFEVIFSRRQKLPSGGDWSPGWRSRWQFVDRHEGGLAISLMKLFIYRLSRRRIRIAGSRSGKIWFTRSEAGGACHLPFAKLWRQAFAAPTNPTVSPQNLL